MYDTIVIGAGQAGLSTGYYLKQTNQKFIIIDKGSEVGNSWKDRYDSLVLFTPRIYSSLPGMPIKGKKHGFPTRDEIVSYFKTYVNRFKIPIQFNTEVISVEKMNGNFFLKTNKDEYQAKNIVIATGAFQTPKIPSFSKNLPNNIHQLHSSQYKNPNEIKDGNVLVVGGGNNGAQIAVELSKERDTYLACSKKPGFLPLVFWNKSIFWWFDKLGILNANNTSLFGKLIQKKGDPIFGYELKNAIKKKEVTVKKRVIGSEQNKVIFEDSTALEVSNIIWATGFKTVLPWLKIDGVLDEKGKIMHHRGVSNIKGVYFIGLPWQYRRGSALIQGVGFDAKYIVRQIMNNE
ncbi:flavin-containing monooxygenase [Oceanobacillus damuensis]|uniref:flavin-containing monooxygenase n=1 Tax=Oceanobacillus damuensis TaxID=937928 RepID=UPI000830AC70|nr:NAD(P)/FAD-dependent oxidoreductase [Oceanobacillus damuensis]